MKAALLVATVAAAAITAVALATPGSGTVGAFLARGTSTEAFSFNTPREVVRTVHRKVRVKGKMVTRRVRVRQTVSSPIISCSAATPCDAVVQTIDFPPGAHTGWHSHPGALVVAVRAGTVTRYEANCTKNTYSAGQTFIEMGPRHVILVRNEGTERAQVYVTYLVPAGTDNPGLRLDQPQPAGCNV